MGHEANFVAGLYYDNYTLKTSDKFMVEDLGATLKYVLAAGCDPQQHSRGAVLARVHGLGNAVDALLNTINKVLGQPLIGSQSAISGLDQRTKDYAAFGQGEWYFLEHWSLIAGLRYAKENRKGQPHSYSDSLIIKAIADQTNFDDSGASALHRTETDFSPKAGLKFQPSKHLEGYFTWAEGYKSGGFNGIPLNPDSIEYEPEKAASLEAGLKIKDRLLNGPIRGSFSVYHTHFSNLQVSTFQGTNVIIVNAAEAHSQGFEADLMWLLPIRGMSLYSSFGFADARYVRYPDGPAPGDFDCGKVGAAAPPQCTCPPDSGKLPGTKRSGCGKNLTGQPLPFAPQWTATLTPAYTFLHLPYAVSVTRRRRHPVPGQPLPQFRGRSTPVAEIHPGDQPAPGIRRRGQWRLGSERGHPEHHRPDLLRPGHRPAPGGGQLRRHPRRQRPFLFMQLLHQLPLRRVLGRTFASGPVQLAGCAERSEAHQVGGSAAANDARLAALSTSYDSCSATCPPAAAAAPAVRAMPSLAWVSAARIAPTVDGASSVPIGASAASLAVQHDGCRTGASRRAGAAWSRRRGRASGSKLCSSMFSASAGDFSLSVVKACTS